MNTPPENGDFKAREASRAENLSHRRHSDEREKKSESHSETVERGVNDAVLSCEHFGSAEDDTVNNDE